MSDKRTGKKAKSIRQPLTSNPDGSPVVVSDLVRTAEAKKKHRK